MTTSSTAVMATQVRDSQGNKLFRMVRRCERGWAVRVWFGGYNGLGTNVRTYVYRTRRQARKGSIADYVGQEGRIS